MNAIFDTILFYDKEYQLICKCYPYKPSTIRYFSTLVIDKFSQYKYQLKKSKFIKHLIRKNIWKYDG